jgi:hypothetical protein
MGRLPQDIVPQKVVAWPGTLCLNCVLATRNVSSLIRVCSSTFNPPRQQKGNQLVPSRPIHAERHSASCGGRVIFVQKAARPRFN